MTSQQTAGDGVQITLLAAGSHPGLAAHTLTRHFGLGLRETEVLLTKGRGIIASQVQAAEALAALPLLTALGLQVAILPLGVKADPETWDLSVRLTDPDSALHVMGALGRLGEACEGDFAGPSGLVIGGIDQARADAICRALRTVRGVHVAVSAAGAARYDLFGPLTGPARVSAPLLRHLAVMGCRADSATSALATDLDRRSLRHVLSRFPDCGLIGVDHAFQRYHVTLTGTGHLTRREMQDFLVTRGFRRPNQSEALSEALAEGNPLRIESGLARAAARQFLTDYATIGIPARAELIRA